MSAPGHDDDGLCWISPSQIGTFLGCERKWALEKIDGLPRPPNRYTKFGLDMHKYREQWLRDHKPPPASKPEGRAALAGLGGLPKPGIALVERHVVLERYAETDGIVYHGYIDAWWDVEEAILVGEIFATVPVYHDHKSTGDLMWAKEIDHEELDRDFVMDPQRIVYGNALLADPQYAEAPGALARWQYTERARPHKTQLVELYQERDVLAFHMKGVHEAGLQIKNAWSEPSSARPRNLRHCGAFGGCPYKDHCHRGITTREKLRGVMAQSDVVKKLKERRAAAAKKAGVNGKSNDNVPSTLRDKMLSRAKRPGRDPEEDRKKYDDNDSETDSMRNPPKKKISKKTNKKTSKKAGSKAKTSNNESGNKQEADNKNETEADENRNGQHHQELGGAMKDLAAVSQIVDTLLDVPQTHRRAVLEAATAVIQANPGQ